MYVEAKEDFPCPIGGIFRHTAEFAPLFIAIIKVSPKPITVLWRLAQNNLL